MEMHQLRYVVAVAKTANFSRAAEQCHVAQPSLSQQIKKLEDELGDLLFAVVNLTRKAKYDAEILLNQATNKFVRRFLALEKEAARQGRGLPEMSLPEMDAIWEKVKDAE